MNNYRIFTDATSDLNEDAMKGLPEAVIIPMPVAVGDTDYLYGTGGNLDVNDFYKMLEAGQFASTTAINPDTYTKYFEPCLKDGMDIIYLCFSSGMSSTIHNAMISADELRDRYPERRITVIDTLCAALGEGFFVLEAARKQAEGLSYDELVQWSIDHRQEVCHWFTVDQFEHLLHGGRVSVTEAFAGTILNIKPLLHVDEKGMLSVMAKPRGNNKAMRMKLEKMEQGWKPEIGTRVLIGHGDCLERAEEFKEKVAARFPDADISIVEIGPVIGAHTGPGMLALLYWGSNR